jgi:hypothetical protein
MAGHFVALAAFFVQSEATSVYEEAKMVGTKRDDNETSFSDLATGTVYRFSEWPNSAVPTFGAGVYTIWHDDGRFVYVGMSGRGMTADTVRRKKPQGIYTRLRSHASGRRSGDQFCVYVADRFVLRTLSQGHRGDCLRPPSNGCSYSPVHSRKPFLPLCDAAE